jgi:hypothetical protein
MAVNTFRVREYLREFNFKDLFREELGWDRFRGQPIEFPLNDTTYRLTPVAEKRGFQIFSCSPDDQGKLPDSATRAKIERHLATLAFEHLIIFVDDSQSMQMWQWTRREPGKPLAIRHETYRRGQTGERLIQKLDALAIDLDEEEDLTVTTVASKAQKAFDVDKVTKKFYDRFKNEHTAFLKFVAGIQNQGDREWYASLMLNRLMFIYFIQKKGFLDGDRNYLRNRLRLVQARRGNGQFLSFYRQFLLRLFHEGLGQPARTSELDQLIGKVPYLNGGLFEVHQLEQDNPAIDIPDEAFERIFDFFDAYDWHLDERPLRADNEINPDVLGYIFEKYINQKQMGAYYTKEDITEYISKNTIIPFLFDAAEKECAIAFRPDSALWSLLRENPDRYIYEAVRKGVDEPLPQSIAAGIHDVSKRDSWNRPADPTVALPTETWREHVARRTRYHDLRAKLSAGEIHTINDLITYNFDIRQFAQDAIQHSEGPELLRAFYKAIERVTVLDPTCGSGAFLFAALNILEPLYEACLERMQAFVDDVDRAIEAVGAYRDTPLQGDIRTPHPKKFADFRSTLERVKQHPNRRYFILKSIILNNLYGVDIMEEAVEICKLRLFLKLVAQLERTEEIEPLPDIDFNIRAGNTLVGFATYDDVKRALTSKFDYNNVMSEIEESAEVADRAFQQFREMQTKRGMAAKDFTEAKRELRRRLRELGDKLNRYLADEYGVDVDNKTEFEKWKSSHQPFHWFVEFYGIMKHGGFDVIIGNPPYVEYSKVRKDYKVRQYKTIEAGNLFAFVMERCVDLSTWGSRIGLIVQLSAFSTPRMIDINLMASKSGHNYISFFECRPGKLFEGIDVRLAIWMCRVDSKNKVSSTRLNRFPSLFRPYLLQSLEYAHVTDLVSSHVTPKLSNDIESSIFRKISRHKVSIGKLRVDSGNYKAYYSYGVRYWARVLNYKPYYKSETTDVSTGEKVLAFQSSELRDIIVCIMTSSLFFWFYCVTSDGHNFTKTVIDAFPVGQLSRATTDSLLRLCSKLMVALEQTAVTRKASYKTTGNIEYKEYDVSSAKPIIDEIDRVLARHYGFTDKELDFIINYDIKYRMGQSAENEE